MNNFEKGVAAALGIPVNIGTPKSLFYPPDMKNGYGAEWFRRKLSTQDIAKLMHVDPSTVHEWRKRGWLEGNKTGTRKGWRKLVFWRHSLKDLEVCVLKMQRRPKYDPDIAYKWWTPQEIEILKRNEQPEGRSPQACRNKRHRLCIQSRL
jgi:hypothetical protein